MNMTAEQNLLAKLKTLSAEQVVEVEALRRIAA